MRTIQLSILLISVVTSASAVEGRWACMSVEGIGMYYENGFWRKHLALDKIVFDVRITSSGGFPRLEFPSWMFSMKDPSCGQNELVPYISCSTSTVIFTLNPKTGNAVMGDIGHWASKEFMKQRGLPDSMLGMNLLVLHCTRTS